MPAVPPQLSAIFASLVEDTAGVHYGPNDRALFESKLAAHAEDAGFESLLDYYYRLRYDDPTGEERRRLVESLVVHETYFFRELSPLVELVDGHLATIVAARGRARVWSAACATGEEPLTLAMLLDDRGLLDKVDIVASDISTQAIARARAGRFSKRALRDGHPPDLARRYLDITASGITVAPRLLSHIGLRTVNLVDDEAVASLGTFDTIVCRNVLIYFRDEQTVQVVARLGRALNSDGLLCVGVSESLLRFGTAMTCEERAGNFFYRRAR